MAQGRAVVKVSLQSGDDIYHHKAYKFNSDRIKIATLVVADTWSQKKKRLWTGDKTFDLSSIMKTNKLSNFITFYYF